MLIANSHPLAMPLKKTDEEYRRWTEEWYNIDLDEQEAEEEYRQELSELRHG